MKKTALVIFEGSLSSHDVEKLFARAQYEVVIAPASLRSDIESRGCEWVNIESFIEPGSIYEANTLLQELSLLKQKDGSRIAKSIQYEGYELWWIHYNNLFVTSCLPYTQYVKLLEFLKEFQKAYLFEPPHEALFTFYLRAYRREFFVLRTAILTTFRVLPFGIFIQIVLTALSLPILAVQRKSTMIFTGDKFAEGKDYDSRMSFIYEEMRGRGLPFVEFIRSLEPWKTVVAHAVWRKRPVVYSVAVQYIAHFVSSVTLARYRRKKTVNVLLSADTDPEMRFKLLLGTQYLYDVDTDIWAIRISKWILQIIGIKSAYITAAVDRNFHAVLGCKLNKIPTVGILHGTATRDYIVYDFLPTFDGAKVLTLDKYGLWSEWWKSYYEEHSRAYRKAQLYLSGPMRPLVQDGIQKGNVEKQGRPIKVLFISEQLAVPEEVLPYLEALMQADDIKVYMKFRPYRDGFEVWLRQHRPEILSAIGEESILRGGMQDAIATCDVVVGSHSTAVLEALLVEKPIGFFATQKWGDCFELKEYHSQHIFYAENPSELIACVKTSGSISVEILRNLRERFFGNPYQNGSKWVVDQLEMALSKHH